MTPERTARLVARWVRLYTRGLPRPIARRRADELDADLHDHIAHERAGGVSDRRIALSILSRMSRGLPADAAWRRRVRPRTGDHMKPLLAVLAAALGVAAIVYGERDDAPGLMLIGLLLIVGAVALVVRTVQRIP